MTSVGSAKRNLTIGIGTCSIQSGARLAETRWQKARIPGLVERNRLDKADAIHVYWFIDKVASRGLLPPSARIWEVSILARYSVFCNLVCIVVVVLIAPLISCSDDNKAANPGFLLSSEVDLDPAWSPDGRCIAYVRVQRVNDSNWVGGMYLYDLDSGQSRLVYDNYWAYSPTWSPDGQWIAYSLWAQLFKMRVDGDSVVQLTSWGANRECCWSPAGNLIAYDKSTVGLWLCNADSSNQRLLYEHAGYVSWFADGFRMAALGLGGEIYIIDTLGDRYEQITSNDEFKYDLAMSPNGDQIVFTQQLPRQVPDLWTVNVDGTNLTRLTFVGGRHPDWSPDGQWIVYTNLAYGNGYLWLIRPDGSEKHQITFAP